MPPLPQSRPPRLLGKAVWHLALALATFLVAGELMLRWKGRATSATPAEPPTAYFRRDPQPGLRYAAVPNAELRFYGRLAQTDDSGCRRTAGPLPPRAPGVGPQAEWRVLCLGDSVTFGVATLDEETWPSQLQRLLQRCLPAGAARCWNLGLPGLNTADILDLARVWLPRDRPQAVVYQFTDNDLDDPMRCSPGGHLVLAGLPPDFPDSYVFTAQPVVLRQQLESALKASPSRPRTWADWLERFAIARRAARPAPGQTPLPFLFLAQGQTPESVRRLDLLARQLRDLRDLCRQHGAELVILHYGWRGYSDSVAAALERLCGQLAVPFDTTVPYADFPTHLKRFSTGLDEHPGIEGCRLLAERAAALLLDSGAARQRNAVAPRGLYRYPRPEGGRAPLRPLPLPPLSPRIELATLTGLDQALGGVGQFQALARHALFALPPPEPRTGALRLVVGHDVPENPAPEVSVDVTVTAGMEPLGRARMTVKRRLDWRYELVFPPSALTGADAYSDQALAEPIWEIRIEATPYWTPSPAQQDEGYWSKSIRFHALEWVSWPPAGAPGPRQ